MKITIQIYIDLLHICTKISQHFYAPLFTTSKPFQFASICAPNSLQSLAWTLPSLQAQKHSGISGSNLHSQVCCPKCQQVTGEKPVLYPSPALLLCLLLNLGLTFFPLTITRLKVEVLEKLSVKFEPMRVRKVSSRREDVECKMELQPVCIAAGCSPGEGKINSWLDKTTPHAGMHFSNSTTRLKTLMKKQALFQYSVCKANKIYKHP